MNGPTTLDPALNIVPETLHHIHIMGICGTGMAALAGLLKKRGFDITGSDENVYPPMSDFLAASGIAVNEGYSAENLSPRPDLVVVGNVIRAVNPEAVALHALQLNYVSMPQALAHFFLKDHLSMVVAGTHGKTTTSSLLASILEHAGGAPGFLIGGIVEAFQRNFNLGNGRHFVVEGDEYDTAFFDKGSKFLHYRPDYAILTSIEFDHADIFADLDVIKKAFMKFVQLIPASGALFAFYDDHVVREIAHYARCPVISYGTSEGCDWQVIDFRANGLQSSFNLLFQGEAAGSYQLPMPGMHNVLNATAVLAMLEHVGFSRKDIQSGMAAFAGIKRRQQVRGEVNAITVIDDFAHHPTAVRETGSSLKEAFPGRRLILVFEPRTNSSRRSIFQEKYSQAFVHGDIIVVREHIPLDSIPREEQFSSQQLVADLKTRGKEAYYFPDTDAILDYLGHSCRPGDVVAVLSNGGFDNIHERLLARLSKNTIQYQ